MKEIFFLKNGRINMVISNYFSVARFLLPLLQEEFPENEVSVVDQRGGFVYFTEVPVKMDIRTGELLLETPKEINTEEFDFKGSISFDMTEAVEKIFGKGVKYCNITEEFLVPNFPNFPTIVGRLDKKKNKIIKWDLQKTLKTGYEDNRSNRKRKENLMNRWRPNQLLKKSMAGFSLGQNYIGGNYFYPCARTVPGPEEMSLKKINQLFYETWLGHVGQLEKYPYEGHRLMPKKLLFKLKKCRNRGDVAQFIQNNWRKIFSDEEVGVIHARV